LSGATIGLAPALAEASGLSYALAVNEVGSGHAQCEVEDGGAFEGCATEYPTGTALTLKATANSGSLFKGCSAGFGSGGSLQRHRYLLLQDRGTQRRDATFLAALTLTVAMSGEGKVESNANQNARLNSRNGKW